MRKQLYTMNHIGITFPDIGAAFVWYRDVLGCFVLAEPADVLNDGSHFGNIVHNIFGDKWGQVKMAHLTTACGVGIEMFQFVKPMTYTPENTFEYHRTGIFHFCLTTSDIDAAAELITKNGGKVLSKTWKLFNKEYRHVLYTQDPWGTIVEFFDAPYDQYFSNMEGVSFPPP